MAQDGLDAASARAHAVLRLADRLLAQFPARGEAVRLVAEANVACAKTIHPP